MDNLGHAGNWFFEMFEFGGQTFIWMFVAFIPILLCLVTVFNAIIKLIGEERILKLARLCTRNMILRYTVLPFLAVFFLTNPTAYQVGKLLPEKQKPAFYDSAVSLIHPITGLFPHANAAELFVFLGIAAGINQLGLPLGPLAVYYLLVGLIVILLRGIVTEMLTKYFMRKNGAGEVNNDV